MVGLKMFSYHKIMFFLVLDESLGTSLDLCLMSLLRPVQDQGIFLICLHMQDIKIGIKHFPLCIRPTFLILLGNYLVFFYMMKRKATIKQK